MKKPELLTDPSPVATDINLACSSAGWWWRYSMPNKDTNDLADAEDFVEIARKVNYRFNGLTERWKALKRIYQVLDIDDYNIRLSKIRKAAKAKRLTLR